MTLPLRAFLSAALVAGIVGAAAPSPARAETPPADRKITIPAGGSPGERVQALWRVTRPFFVEDGKAALDDAEYLKRRVPIYNGWGELRTALASEAQASVAGDVIDEIQKLVADLYGRDYVKPLPRQRTRAITKESLDDRLAAIDKRVAALAH